MNVQQKLTSYPCWRINLYTTVSRKAVSAWIGAFESLFEATRTRRFDDNFPQLGVVIYRNMQRRLGIQFQFPWAIWTKRTKDHMTCSPIGTPLLILRDIQLGDIHLACEGIILLCYSYYCRYCGPPKIYLYIVGLMINHNWVLKMGNDSFSGWGCSSPGKFE